MQVSTCLKVNNIASTLAMRLDRFQKKIDVIFKQAIKQNIKQISLVF